MIWAIITRLFGFMWKYRAVLAIGAVASLIFGLWQLSKHRAGVIEELKARISRQTDVIEGQERAGRELEGKADHDKTNSKIAADSAAAVAKGRINGDGPMSPVLRAEYERVRSLAEERRSGAR